MVDADRWQHLIEASLAHLHIFEFHFGYCAIDSYDEKLIKLRQFQTDFWHKQHHWHSNYEIDQFLVSVYTIPYMRNEFRLISDMDRYGNSLNNHINEFDNVRDLTLWKVAIRNNSSYYFKNIQSLTIATSIHNIYRYTYNDAETDMYNSAERQIEFLNRLVNLSSVKQLIIDRGCAITSSLLLEMLKKLPNVSSLTINEWALIPLLENHHLCESLNQKIITLDISGDRRNIYIKSSDIDSFCIASSNLRQLKYDINNLNTVLLILGKC